MHETNTADWEHTHSFGLERRRPGERRTLIVALLTAATMVVEIVAGAQTPTLGARATPYLLQAASGDSTAAPNRSSSSASRRSASSMLRALTWPKPRIRSGSDAISTATAWLA